jgi:hypothetical protein
MDQRIIDLYDHFTHGGMNRRDFMDRLIKLSGSTVAATALLPLLQNNYAQAAVVAENDPRLVTERVTFDSPKGKINGYLARPKSKGKRPVILVIHENRGSIRIWRMSRGASRSRASSPTLSTCCHWSAGHLPARMRHATCTRR